MEVEVEIWIDVQDTDCDKHANIHKVQMIKIASLKW